MQIISDPLFLDPRISEAMVTLPTPVQTWAEEFGGDGEPLSSRAASPADSDVYVTVWRPPLLLINRSVEVSAPTSGPHRCGAAHRFRHCSAGACVLRPPRTTHV